MSDLGFRRAIHLPHRLEDYPSLFLSEVRQPRHSLQ